MIPAPLIGFFVQHAAKLGVAAVVAVVSFGAGLKLGLRWDAGKVASAKQETAEARATAGKQEQRAAQAERDYNQLRREVADAMEMARDRAVELEQANEQARQAAATDYRKRVDGVLDSHRRLLESVAESRRPGASRPVPSGCPVRGFDDPAGEDRFVERLREAALAEARLSALQDLVAAHDAATKTAP